MKSKILAFVCAGFAMTGVAFANGDLKAEIADLRAKVASLETTQMAPAAGGDCSSLTSMKKKGCITIGGQAQIDIVVLQKERMNNPTAADAITTKAALDANTSGRRLESGDRINTTYFGTGLPYDVAGTYLDFKIDAGCDTYLYLKLDLDDLQDGAGANDLLEEVYFAWDNVRGSCWDIRLGKKLVDYGQDKFTGITPSFQDGWAYWMTADLAAGPQYLGDAYGAAGTAWPTAPLNVYQIEAMYQWKDLVNVYATLFQNATGMHEDRSDDNLFFESYALKVEYMPFENLTLQGSYMNQHDENDNGANGGTVAARSNQRAISLAADYTFKCRPLNIWTEYQHAWDLGYDGDSSCDVFSVGATYGLTENIDISILGEYAQVDGSNNINLTDTAGNGVVEDENFTQVVVNGTYTFDNGIYMTLEYSHGWYDAEIGGGFQDEERDVDMFGFRTGWEF